MLGLVLGCVTTPKPHVSKSRPAWVDGKMEAQYPRALFIVGVGVASSSKEIQGENESIQRRADNQARAEIAKQIRVQIAQQEVDIQREERGVNASVLSSEFAEVVNTSSVRLTLEGVEICSHWIDPAEGVYYALAVLNRDEAAGRLAENMDLSVKRGLEWDRLSQKYASAGDVILELKALTHALAFLGKAFQEYQVYRVVRSEGPSLREAQDLPPTTLLESRLLERSSQIQLEILGGDLQRGEVGHPLEQKLHVRVTWNGSPLSGLPLLFSFGTGVGEVDGIVLTDASGEARAQVHRVGPSGKSQNTIEARLFPAGLLDSEEWGEEGIRSLQSLEGPPAIFTYSLLTLNSVRVAVWIDSPVGDKMAEALAQAGYRMVDRSIVAHGMKGVDSKILLSEPFVEKFKGIVDVLVVGEIEVTSTERIQSGFVFAKVRGTARALQVDRGLELFSVGEEEKGAGRDSHQAQRMATQALGEKLSQEVVKALEKSL